MLILRLSFFTTTVVRRQKSLPYRIVLVLHYDRLSYANNCVNLNVPFHYTTRKPLSSFHEIFYVGFLSGLLNFSSFEIPFHFTMNTMGTFSITCILFATSSLVTLNSFLNCQQLVVFAPYPENKIKIN